MGDVTCLSIPRKRKVEQVRSRKTGEQADLQTDNCAAVCSLLYSPEFPSKLGEACVSYGFDRSQMAGELNQSGESGPVSSL